MDTRALYRQMSDYHHWRQDLSQRLRRFEHWARSHELVSDEMQRCLGRARQLLGEDGFTLACVGEFSRGKTELINALLMDERGQRLLPSLPGRTTMCPSEILCDPDHPNCLRLLPIQTRRSRAGLARFRRIPRHWQTRPLDPDDPESLREALNEVSSTCWVSEEEAERLGFDTGEQTERDHLGRVAIPRWRHALISLEHPLLRRGLRIVDTPGLNALGNEPELTLRVLPRAQAIVFLLSADAGVTASDMALWREHIQNLSTERGSAVLTLLNKVDNLWDDLRSDTEVNQSVEAVRELTARQLDLDLQQVLPLSAKRALLARAGGQRRELEQSGFPELERALAQTVARSQKRLAGHRLIADSQTMMDNVHRSLKGRLAEAERELKALSESRDEHWEQTLDRQRAVIRDKHRQCHKQTLSLRTSQMLIERQSPALKHPVAPQRLAQAITNTRERLEHSWTTMGLSGAMGELFDWLSHQMGHLEREVERANRLLDSIYERPEHGGQEGNARRYRLSLTDERRQLRQLQARSDRFRASLDSFLSPKGPLIQRFVGTLVQEARSLWEQLDRSIDHWLAQALVPLFQHNRYQRQLLDHHMLRLSELNQQRRSRAEQETALAENVERMKAALADLETARLGDAATAEERSATVVPLRRARHAG